MSQPTIQASFNSGEWAPTLTGRVDMAKYRSGAALLRNFFVDYRGGASTRTGTKYILAGYKPATPIRLIPFQASFTVGYVLEFGDKYIRFYNNGAPVLEAAKTVTGATNANPCVLACASHGFSTGDWVYAATFVGMTQLNGNYYSVTVVDANHISLKSIFDGSTVDSTTWGTYTSGGTVSRVYTLVSPFAATDLAKVKYAQNVTQLILCHPNYAPQVLTLVTSANWSIGAVTFGSTLSAPTGLTASTTLAAGSVNYSYAVTSVDASGQESAVATVALSSKADLRTTSATTSLSWTAATGATSYNIYKAELSYSGPVPSGAQYGYIGNCTGVAFADSNIAPDFTTCPAIPQNPFSGSGVATVAVTNGGSYSTIPSVTFSAPGAGSTASGYVTMAATSVVASQNVGVYYPGTGFSLGYGITIYITGTTSSPGFITSCIITATGTYAGTLPPNPLYDAYGTAYTITYTVTGVVLTSPGSGYGSAPSLTFSPASTTAANATLGAASAGNPAVPGFFQQRMLLAGQVNAPQSLNFSRTGAYFNYDYSNPIQADDAITTSIAAGQLNEIKSVVSSPSGLILLTNSGMWLVNGGSGGVAITPSAIVANAQSYIGANDIPPIVSNYDILFVQAKGSVVRDASYNFYANVYTGTDISILSSHLFYNYQVVGWAWAEEPYKIVYAVRNDGAMLTLTFMKEQELVAWAHSDTTGGLFKSVATITESVGIGSVNAVYTVVQRSYNGTIVQYIERFAERNFVAGAADAWCVDAGLQYNSAATTSFTGAQHLAGQTVTGLADGVVIPSFTMPASGSFTLGTAASKVTIGIGFTAQLQTLRLDLGEPTAQGKDKKITSVNVRVADTLGLSIGSSFSNLVPMKDLIVGNVGRMTNQVVTGLVTGDAWTFIDPLWSAQGQFCIQQSQPLPATILAVMPNVNVGDTAK